MRLWSIHPQYLDAKGLVALWREALLAQKVLMGKTKGYTNHPQLNRFKAQEKPVEAIAVYLYAVYQEALARAYCFDKDKIHPANYDLRKSIKVTQGQIRYEFEHLSRKLKIREPKKLTINQRVKRITPHPLFYTVKGDIEAWEIR